MIIKDKKADLQNNKQKIKNERDNKPKLSLEQLKSMLNEIYNVDSLDKQCIDDIIYNVEVDINNNIYINFRYDIFEMV